MKKFIIFILEICVFITSSFGINKNICSDNKIGVSTNITNSDQKYEASSDQTTTAFLQFCYYEGTHKYKYYDSNHTTMN
jgi:hypothetical protein